MKRVRTATHEWVPRFSLRPFGEGLIFPDQLKLPVPVRKEWKPIPSCPSLRLTDEAYITINQQMIPLPAGVNGRITGGAIKRLGQIYRGEILLVDDGDGWRAVGEKETVDLNRGRFRTERPVVRSGPRYTTD